MRWGLALIGLALGPRVALVSPDGPATGPYELPLPATVVTPADLRAPHHDYPASDLMVPTGTPVFAAAAGRARVVAGERCGRGVAIEGDDGYRYVSCHLDRVSVEDERRIEAGDVIGLSGDTGNARGVPHLHFHVRDRSGRYLCPQPLLLAWYERRTPPPGAWRTTDGCTS